MKTLTTPRLELCAATIAVRLDKKLRAKLNLPCPLKPSVFWTDSVFVLIYIDNESSVFHTFVANKVPLIRDLSQPKQWRYIPTQKNPADDASQSACSPTTLAIWPYIFVAVKVVLAQPTSFNKTRCY